MTKQNAQHTPGPWRVDTDAQGDPTQIVMAGEHQMVAGVYDLMGFRDHSQSEAEANALLIAAAPDLLAACEKAADALSAAFPHADRIRDLLLPALEAARDAVVKARRETADRLERRQDVTR